MEMEKINHFSAIIVDDLDLIPDLFLIKSRIIPYTIFTVKAASHTRADCLFP